ncbi:class I SAM-dependent methyltransferase [Bradyrhizobium sp. HKCCYLS2038]|uniref:class I SAM-dependent methyltransferase n=1 Tax=unclassified Bradyrhizobium TaxID=2631580 RepID=UPI003EBB14D4
MTNPYRMFVRPEGIDGERGIDLMEQLGDGMANEAVANLRLTPTDEVIEIGFGPGIALQILLQTVQQGHVTGVDPSRLMHRHAGLRNETAIRAGRIKLIEGTVDALPFAAASFDAALAMDNLHFWPDRLAGLKELRRVLRPGSPFLCSFTPPSGGSTVGLAKDMAAASFVDIEQVACLKGQAIVCRVPR